MLSLLADKETFPRSPAGKVYHLGQRFAPWVAYSRRFFGGDEIREETPGDQGAEREDSTD